MKNVAFMFPGQGSQYVGMGKYFYENFSDAEERRVFYVALTRAKKDVYLLSPLSSNKRSPFLNELDVF